MPSPVFSLAIIAAALSGTAFAQNIPQNWNWNVIDFVAGCGGRSACSFEFNVTIPSAHWVPQNTEVGDLRTYCEASTGFYGYNYAPCDDKRVATRFEAPAPGQDPSRIWISYKYEGQGSANFTGQSYPGDVKMWSPELGALNFTVPALMYG